MNPRKYFLFFALSIFLCSALFSQENLRVSYVANAGVLIKSGDSKILIDGLFGSNYGNYDHPSENELKMIQEGLPPYDNIDVVLVSHIHADHFDPELVLSLIKSQPKITCIVNSQVSDSLLAYTNDKKVKKQIKSFSNQSINDFSMKGIDIKTFKVDHASSDSYGWIENTGHIINMGGRKVLHLGDPNYSERPICDLDLSKQRIDIGILPYWLMGDSKSINISDSVIHAKDYIVNHFPLNLSDKYTDFYKQYSNIHMIDRESGLVISTGN